eukprot:6212942-Pleurochrysis_carterae.AAC.1
MSMAKRESAPTRAQQQAARPEYTLKVEREKQVKAEPVGRQTGREKSKRKCTATNVLTLSAGTRGGGARGVRSGGEGRRRRKRSTSSRTERPPHADDLSGLPPQAGELPFHTTEVQVLPMQPFATRHTHQATGLRFRGRKEGTHASLAAGEQRTRGRSGRSQQGRGDRRQAQGRNERLVNGREVEPKARQGGPRRSGSMPEYDADGTNATQHERNMLSVARGTQHGRYVPQDNCGIDGAIQCAIWNVDANGINAIQPGRNFLNAPCNTDCAIQTTLRQNMLWIKEYMEWTKGHKGPEVKTPWYVWSGVCCMAFTWLMRKGKGRAKTEPGEHREEKGGSKASRCVSRMTQQRRLTQQRMRRWNKTRKVNQGDKDRKKYRHKVRASLRWMRRNDDGVEATEANIKEGRNRARTLKGINKKRKGGAGGGTKART